ncbi:MAG: hypothetical protein JJV98_02885 [Desulfosarcina sp.]|nr:hypothetical protein [Desulfobacterales bacterium]
MDMLDIPAFSRFVPACAAILKMAIAFVRALNAALQAGFAHKAKLFILRAHHEVRDDAAHQRFINTVLGRLAQQIIDLLLQFATGIAL